jgi:uncharacterized protein
MNLRMSEALPDQPSKIHRRVAQRIETALQDTRVVLIAGPRQAGKTTLARAFETDSRPYITLDDAPTLQAARSDPVGFMRGFDQAVIDEVQRAPDLLLAIKERVDRDQKPGRFLLTGSANLTAIPKIADSLAGRMEVINLLPFAQAELRNAPGNFIDRAFSSEVPKLTGDALFGAALAEAVLRGGYPEAIGRESAARRRRWFENYVVSILHRDVQDIANIDQLDRLPRLLRILSEHPGQLVNHTSFGASLSLSHKTAQKYVSILERLFLVKTLEPWSSNDVSRIIKTAKLTFLDSGLLAMLRGADAAIISADRSKFGPLLENFVVSEIFKLASWNEDPYRFSHFRTREQEEVDLVIEDRLGRIVGIEVKASAAIKASDFNGLKRLQQAAGDRFVRGILMHDHDRVTPFGERLHAMPVSRLWTL